MGLMDLFFSAIMLGLFALILAELVGRGVSRLVSLLRQDIDPDSLAPYIQRVSTVVITTSWAWYLEDSAGDIILLAGAGAAIALMAQNWLNRPTIVVPSPSHRRR